MASKSRSDTLTDEQVDKLKQQLLHLRDELQQLLRLSESASETVVLDQTKVGRLSRIDALQQQAMAQANRASYQDRLQQVNRALQGMLSDDYGYCESCGEVIAFDRLQVKPESSLCVSCQHKREQS